ncbi:CinA family protein [Amycolatopsis thailandensis]|uniref:CinA family protein n=1 Tax=Amycolatopsis thailandensis TaxID=589330 RepID=UPI0036446960
MNAETLITHLIERKETVATAESLTAGLVCARLTEIPGSSAVVRGALIVYATDLKATLAGVDEDLLAAHGAVHPEVAAQLATGARERCGATWGLGLTGVAGPAGQDGVAPGTVHVGLAGPDGLTVRTLDLSGDRASVRDGAVRGAFALLGEHLA